MLRGETIRGLELQVRRRSDGRMWQVQYSGAPVIGSAGEVTLAVMVHRDITQQRDIQRQLRRTEEDAEAFFNASSVGMIQVDPGSGRFVRVNDAFCQLVGYSKEELLTKTEVDVTALEDRPFFAEQLARMAAGEFDHYDHERRYVRKDGQIVWAQVSANLIRDPTGRPLRTAAVVRDITEQRLAEAALRESEARYRTLFETIDEGFCTLQMIFDEQGQAIDYIFLSANPAFTRHTGLENAVGRSIRELVPDLNEEWFEAYGRVALTGESIRFEQHAPAMQRWFEVHASRIGPPEQRRVALVFQNTTARKQAEQALRDSEARYRTLFNTMDQAFCTVEMIFDDNYKAMDYRIVDVNPAFERQSGLSDAIGRTARDMVPELNDEWFAMFGQIALSGQARRFEQHADGLGRWFDVFAYRIGPPEQHRVAVLFTNISERKATELRLRDSEQRFRIALGTAPLVIFEQDTDLRYTWIQQTPFGMTADDYVGKTDREVTPESAGAIEAAKRQALATGEAVRVTLPVTDHGQTTWWELSSEPRRDEAGNIVGLVSAAYNITERKLLEDQLRQREQHLSNVLDSLFAFVGALRPDGTLLYANRAPLERGGLRHEDVVGKLMHETPWFTHDPSVAEQVRQSWERAAQSESSRFDMRVRMKDGPMLIDYMIAPMRDAEGRITHLIPSGVDIADRERAINAMRESEERFRLLADNIAQLAWMTDHTGWIHWYNQRWFDYTGTTQEEMEGWGWQKVHHPEHVQRVTDKFRDAIERGEKWEDLFPIRRHDGEYRWFLSRAFPIRDDAGRVIRWFGTNTDVTEQRNIEHALRRSEAQFRQLAEALPQLIWVTNPEGANIYVNQTWCDYTGQRFDEAMGWGWLAVVHPDDRAHSAERWRQSVETSRPYQIEYRLRSANGEYRWFVGRGVPVQDDDGSIGRWFGTCSDIHDAKAAEDVLQRRVAQRTSELEAANDLLRGEIAERTRIQRELAHNVRELERSNHELQQFAYVASHDLQEPLRTITSYSQLLTRKFAGQIADGDQVNEYVQFITEGATRMRQLILDLLAYSRVGSKPVELRAVSLEQIVWQARQNLDDALRAAEAEVVVSNLPTINVDEGQLIQVFQNLIANAIKFRQPGIKPVVRVFGTRLADAWQISVQDNGIGLDMAYAEKIFLIFQRLHTRKRYPGSGIGLSICKKVIAQHGGKIWVDSTLGAGATFHFTLPDRIEPPTSSVD